MGFGCAVASFLVAGVFFRAGFGWVVGVDLDEVDSLRYF
jgi:hypothetical protein